MNKNKSIIELLTEKIQSGALFVRAGPCFWHGVFRVPKNGVLETNKPPAMRVVGTALAYSIKPPML